MEPKETKNLKTVGAILAACLIVVWLSGSIQGSRKNYEVKPEITLPEYQNDTTRAIDAYERVMDRFIDLTEVNLTGINTDVKDIAKKLVLIDSKLTELSTRMARIEKALGIEQAEKPSASPRGEQVEETTEAKAQVSVTNESPLPASPMKQGEQSQK
jgi:hypothetical protein